MAQAAEHFGCSTKTLRRRISDGTLAAYRFGPKMLRLDMTEVDAVLRPIPTAATSL